MPRFEVDWIKTQGEIAHLNLTLINIVTQKILNKSGRITENSFKKRHIITLQYIRIVVPRFEVDWMENEIGLRNLDTEECK